MKTAVFVSLLSLCATNVFALPESRRSTDEAAKLSDLLEHIKELQLTALKEENANLKQRGSAPKCNLNNVAIRREYGSLSKAERLDYVNAVKCLQKKPARTPAGIAAGAKSRFDDFTVTHMQQTLDIHFTGNFLTWHRWFLYVYEEALRKECGYKGYAPYWDWLKYASAPEKSPIFNGDAYSLGGNGKYIPHNGTVLLPPPGAPGGPVPLPPGYGSGCVETGPFKDFTVNLGPIALPASIPAANPFAYNPRCMKRDVGPGLAKIWHTPKIMLDVLTSKTLADFRAIFEGIPYTANLGPHGAGHFTINGDPGGDLFVSPGDPAFWVHHSQVDRIYTLWQALDQKTREKTLSGTRTWLNQPPSPDTTLEDIISLGYAGPNIKIGDVMSTTDGPLCYIYL